VLPGDDRVRDLAWVYTMVGQFELAVDQLEVLLVRPSALSVPWLTLDSPWDPLRDYPRHQALLEKYG